MNTAPPSFKRPLLRTAGVLTMFLVMFVGRPNALAFVSAGGMAVIGYDDFSGSFTVVTLQPINAGEDIYFTNNGWSSSLHMFNGAASDQGAGNESLIKLSTTGVVAKGTVITSTISGTNFVWTSSGVVPGTTNRAGMFSKLNLDSQSDQIYAFQAPTDNPLLNPTNFIYALHFGDVEHPGFSDASDQLTGDIPPGLSLSDHTAFAQTDLTFHGDGDGNHSAWGLDVNSPLIASLQVFGAHKENWLAAISDSGNWSDAQPSVTRLSVAPEPTRTLLIAVGIAAMSLRRNRRR